MATLGAGQSASSRSSDVPLGLVGVPHTQESIQDATRFEFDFNPSIDPSNEQDASINAHIDAFYANPGLPEGQSLNDLRAKSDWVLPTNFETLGMLPPFLLNEQYPQSTNDMIAIGSCPEQQHFTYPEPQSYLSAHEAPYFGNIYGALDPSADVFGTQGLAAIPGDDAFVELENNSDPSQAYANTNETSMLPAEICALPTLHMDYEPADNASYNDIWEQLALYPDGLHAATAVPASAIGPVFAKEGTQEGLHDSDADPDKDYHDDEVKPSKTSKRTTQMKPRKDSVSSVSTSAATPGEPVKYQPGEKPRKVDAKPWIRTNANTEGDTRTAKINHWKNKYEYKPLPLGEWSSGKHMFKYTKYENVDFLTEAPMSTHKVKEYIMNYPCSDLKRLILWIQKMPADQGRRYGSKQHSKCVFKDCPIQRYVEGTISTGEYRVAFDEKHHAYGNSVDPYDCAAYAHLYCMEQFLDFEQVCRAADVRVDTRIDLPLEPNGRAAFSMVDVPARREMERFVKAASKGNLRQIQGWNNYPLHAKYNRDEQKPHERTLTYQAHCMYEAHQDDSHKRQAARRPVTVSQRRVHLGDLEMSVADKRIMMEVYGGKKKGRNVDVEGHYDERILFHIARAKLEAKEFLGHARKGQHAVKKGNKAKKRQLIESEDTDSEQSVDEYARRRKLRTTRQKKQRVNYVDSPVVPQHQYAQALYMQPQPVQHALTPAQQVQHLQTYMKTNSSYAPEPPQAQIPVDPTLDTLYGAYTVPVTPEFDISDFSSFPACEADLSDDNLERLLALERRQSHMEDLSPMSILKSPTLTPSGQTRRLAGSVRRAGFGAQPVSDSKEYDVNDPPSLLSKRRSARLAEKKRPGGR
ncbi:hypothetical protein SVAN01_02710 [Stagonosporopsis vannaccii]|nr:hypothetical protein SVAN01_02710 [Stagonosporopsis vannaccii]